MWRCDRLHASGDTLPGGQCAAVGPVHIVDEQQERGAFAEQREECPNVVEDALALGLRLEQQIRWNIRITGAQGRGNGEQIGKDAGRDFTLTPALSLRERETALPSPGGRGKGEGDRSKVKWNGIEMSL